MGAAGDLVIPELIPRLPVRTRPLLPQESPCRPSEQGNGRPVYDTVTSTSTPRPEADGPHPYDTILGTQEMALPVLRIATSTTSASMPKTPWLWNRTHRFQLRMRLEMPSTESGEQRAPSPGTECERENLAPERSKRWNIVEGKGMWRVEKKVRDFVDSILPSLAWGSGGQGTGMVSGPYPIEAPCARSCPVRYHGGLKVHTAQVPEKRHTRTHTQARGQRRASRR